MNSTPGSSNQIDSTPSKGNWHDTLRTEPKPAIVISIPPGWGVRDILRSELYRELSSPFRVISGSWLRLMRQS